MEESKPIKTLVLASGGIDSIVLLYMLAVRGHIIEVMHFNYGNITYEKELEYLKKYVSEINEILIEPIKITEVNLSIPWSKATLVGGEVNVEYIEMRNLIFLSYALSYAQANGFNNVAIGIVNSYENAYIDANEEFIKKMNEVAKMAGIKIIAPLKDWDKLEVVNFSNIVMGLRPKDFWYCNFPIKENNELKPCGTCLKCKVVEELSGYF